MDMSLPATSSRQVTLKELSPKHRQVAALLAQGVNREMVAAACDFTPEYVTWLGGDPLFIDYIKEMSKLAGTQLEAMYTRSVEVIGENLMAGSNEDKMRAARLQMEATGRIGKNIRPAGDDSGMDRLEVLAERLLVLGRRQQERTINGEAQVVEET